MSNYFYGFDWQPIPSGIADSFREVSMTSGAAIRFGTSQLPPGQQKMAGLRAAYWSGYFPTSNVVDGITGVGEVICIREADGILKAYTHPVGRSGTRSFIGSQFKRFSGHHFPSGTPLPERAFGHIPWPSRSGEQ